jgi:putative membrane protein
MLSVIRRTPIAALCAATLVAACSKGDKSADSTGAANSTATGSAAGAGASTGASAANTAQPAQAPMSDANVLALLDEANVADSATGSIAATKGTSSQVKAFGRDMVRDHHAMRQQGMTTAKQANITPDMPSNGANMKQQDQALADSLTSMPKGAEWDKFYIDHAVMQHQAVLTMAQDGMNAAQNSAVKTLIQQASPKVQSHLDHAKQIQSKMGGAGSTGTTGGSGDTTKKR